SNGNITDMIDAMNADREISSVFTGSFEDFSSLLTDGIAISVNTASDLTDSCNTIVNSILDEREAVSGVSTDEETVNMIKFQKAYQASARLMTAMDEMLETLINKMGVVGL
ncbi:MAG: flagellar hook-associated protein FlgK, partial [Clostridiales bacterium]|nr:flagellar hook-associated protein FlgK [Clostridiales bacterium]